MVKLGLIGLFLSLFTITANRSFEPSTDVKNSLITEQNERGNYTLTGITGTFEDEFRIYHYDDLLIDEVSDDAFNGQTFKTLMLSNSVTHISDTLFANTPSITKMKFTGSEEEYNALNLTTEFAVLSFYAFDEGFINYWNKYVRPGEGSNVCDITPEQFNYVYSLYKNLSGEDLKAVDKYTDLAGAKISDSMKELVKKFVHDGKSQKTTEWNQAGAIKLIIFIAIIGMTSITVFFLLKTKKIINQHNRYLQKSIEVIKFIGNL